MDEKFSTFPRNKGSDGTHGINFEYETTLLAYLKCVAEHDEWNGTNNSGLKSFFVANNVEGVGAFDDVVVRKEIVKDGETTSKLTFTQCKHVAGNESSVRKGENYLGRNKIQKYFESFIEIYKIFHQDKSVQSASGAEEKKMKDNENETAKRLKLKTLFNCQFSDCEFSFVSNIVSVPEELFEKVKENNGNEDTSNSDTGIHSEKSEYRLRSYKCQEFLKCSEFVKLKKDLFHQFCNKLRVFTIKEEKRYLEVDNTISKLCDNDLKAHLKEKKILRDMLLKEAKLSYESSTLFTEKIHTFQNIRDFLYLRKLTEYKINNYSQIIPLDLDNATKIINKLKVNNQTEFKRLIKLRIIRSFFYLNQVHICIIVSTDEDFTIWKSARNTLSYKTENKIFIFFEIYNSIAESEEANETFVKLVHKTKIQRKSTLFHHLYEDELSVVANAKIVFQGFKIALKELCSSWFEFLDEDAVCNILESQQLVVGTELPTEPRFYIQRKLKISVLGEKIRNLIETSVQSVQKTGNEKYLLFLHNERNADRFNNRSSGNVKNTCKFIENINEARSELSKLLTKKDLSFYFCNYDSDKFELRYTFRNDKKFLEDRIVDEGYLITKCESGKITFLSDVAGMGKSTSMLKLAAEYKIRNKTHWIYYIQLEKFSIDFEKAKTINDSSNAIDFLATKLLKLVGTDVKLFTAACIKTENVAIFLDGFDELSQEARQVFSTYLLALEETKIHKIFVSSRPNLMRDLENLILQNAIEFVQLNFEDKENCLLEIWKQKLAETGDNVESEKLITIAEKIFKDTESERNSIKEILAIPLQIKIFAVAYYDKMLEYCKGNADFNIQFNILHLYKNFIHSQVTHYHEKNISEWNVMHKDKRQKYIRDKLMGVPEFVCSLVVPNLVRNKIEDIEDKIENLRDDLGLITDDSQTPPLFLHKTIAEYLAAEFIVTKFLSQSNDEESEQVFGSILIEDRYDMLRIFINSLLDEKNFPAFFNPKKKAIPDEMVRKNTPFYVASSEGNETLMKAILQRCKNFINLRDNEGVTALHVACNENKIETVKLLLSQDCSIVQRDNDGNTAFHFAAKKGNREIMEILLLRDASLLCMENNHSYTPLRYACSSDEIESVMFILSHKCSVIDRANSTSTASDFTVDPGHTEMFEKLLQLVASPLGMQNNDVLTHLHRTCLRERIEAVLILLYQNCSDVEIKNESDTAFNIAAENGHTEIMEMLSQLDTSLRNNQNNHVVTELQNFFARRRRCEIL